MSRTRNKRLGANLRAKPSKREPFPGMIDGNVWQIRDGKHPAFVMRKDGQYLMQVPMGDSDCDRRLRLHEQGHVAFTGWIDDLDNPPKDVEFDTLNAVEDSRIAIKLERVDPEYGRINREVPILDHRMLSGIYSDFQEQQKALEMTGSSDAVSTPPNLLEVARYIAASKGYCEEDDIRSFATDSDFDWINEIVDDLHNEYFGHNSDVTFDDTIAYARELEKRVGNMQSLLEAQFREANEALQEANLEHLARGYPDHEWDTQWGKMSIVHPPLTERMPTGIRHWKNRAADQGVIPTNWHRFATDKRVFNRRKLRRDECGTILIDQSGSMHLSPTEMLGIMRNWPGVVIAGYSGYGDRYGELRILAKNGKMIHTKHMSPRGGANIIDGPALDWLAKQQQPRIWISDGYVTGIGESQTRELLLDAAKKVKRGKIIRIDNVREILGEGGT